MKKDEILDTLHDRRVILPREEKIRLTVQASKEAYFRMEREGGLNRWEFLGSQFAFTRKRWWVFQGALLSLACHLLPALEQDFHRVRSLGVVGCLFVVLMIPELWRNRESDSIQVEAACFYSLRQIYAARLTLFSLVDLALLTVFSLNLGRMGLGIMDVISQFLLPVAVAACICFGSLRGGQNGSEAFSIACCLIWCAAWWLILMNEKLYLKVVPSVWAALFGGAMLLLILTARQMVRTTNQHWEVNYS